MSNLFSYDSKPMQVLTAVGDYIILNLLFLLCCIPVITIGAAQAGLYSGVRVLQDKEDDSSCVAAFFRGFKSGFGQITLVWCVFLVLIGVLTYSLILVLILANTGSNAPVITSIAALTFCTLFQSLTSLFHARFSCTAFQLVRNAWLLFFSHPLRSLAVAILTWLPAFLFVWNLYLFLVALPVFTLCYYSLAFRVNFFLMKKPFDKLIENFNETHGAQPSSEESEEN